MDGTATQDLQECITLAVFIVIAFALFRSPLKWNYCVAYALIVGAVFFAFKFEEGESGSWEPEEGGNHTRRLSCLPPGVATCYPRSVNRNIFYIIGVIVVIIIVLKVLGLF